MALRMIAPKLSSIHTLVAGSYFHCRAPRNIVARIKNISATTSILTNSSPAFFD